MAVIAPPVPPGLDGVTGAAPAIRVRGVWHAYRARTGRSIPALAPLDLEVPRGELVAILGPSGCGKTTLLRILSGLLAPSGGEVRLGGTSPALACQRRAVGWLAQDDGLLSWRSVADNVALPLRLGGMAASQTERIAEALAQVGLADSGSLYPYELSGGMRQRAALARALVAEPPFLFLDEPFAHLDELTRERLGEVLLSAIRCGSEGTLRSDLRPAAYADALDTDLTASRLLSRQVRQPTDPGALLDGGDRVARPTTVLVTHSVEEAVRLADRVLVLSDRPARVCLDEPLHLDHPRREDQPGFGVRVRHLKDALRATERVA